MKLSELKVLYEVLNENRERVEHAIQSIAGGLVSISDFENSDWFQHQCRYYSGEEYVITFYGKVLERCDAFYCNGKDDWFSDDEAVSVYEYRTETIYSREWAENNSDLSEYNGEYYDSDALSYHELVYVEDVGAIWNECDAYYNDNEGCYYSFSNREEEYVRDYHNGCYQSINFDGKSKYKIGYEIEKEDEEVMESICIEDFENDTNGDWRKEKDGSLNSDCGYELISPTFEFNIDKIFEHIESNDVLVKHINAGISTRCGGHIHLSENGLSGEQLFDKVKGYTPLLYALYYGRVSQNYCKGKANRDLRYENEKYQAIKIHDNRIEFRIISAVPTVKTLKWRSKLLMMMLQNPTHDIIKAYYNVDTKFTKILKQTYSDDKLVELKDRFVKFTKDFEGIDIKNNNNNK